MKKLRGFKYKFTKDSKEWKAVKNKDFSFNDCFWYASCKGVSYCRPSCKSRTKFNIHELTWFRTPEEAIECGYKKCARCVTSQSQRIKETEELIIWYVKTYRRTPSLKYLANEFDISESHFHRTSKLGTKGSQTIKQFAKQQLDKFMKCNYEQSQQPAKVSSKNESMLFFGVNYKRNKTKNYSGHTFCIQG